MSGRDLVGCPECGAEFPAGRLACPECGSDAETGWKDEEEVQYQSVDLPDEEWSSQDKPGGFHGRYLLVALILAILGMLIFVLVR
ncbi:MAG: hypothetical protein ACYST0_10160 [Planctomycetota bacterium]|jgi:hypothetical protein